MEAWKICRALNNKSRLELLWRIANSPGRALNVLQAGDFVGLGKAAASQYLKQLSDAGFLTVERSGKFVVCSSKLPSEAPTSHVQRSLIELLAKKAHYSSPDETLATINAFAHHVRLRIVRAVTQSEPVGFELLYKMTGLPPATLRRQISILVKAKVLAAGDDGGGARAYSLVRNGSALCRALLKLAMSER